MFAKRLKDLRKQKNITQEQLATIIGLERSSIGKYEGKSNVIPSAENLQAIADFFNVSVDYLLGREDRQKKELSLDQQLEGIDFALWGEVKDLTEAQKQDILKFVKFVKQQAKENTKE